MKADSNTTVNQHILDRLASLPVDCESSADALEKQREIFEARRVFDPQLIDGTLKSLRSFDPEESRRAKDDPEKMAEMVKRFFYVG